MIKFICKIICDGCHLEIAEASESRSTNINGAYCDAMNLGRKAGMLIRNVGHGRKHYCLGCCQKNEAVMPFHTARLLKR